VFAGKAHLYINHWSLCAVPLIFVTRLHDPGFTFAGRPSSKKQFRKSGRTFSWLRQEDGPVPWSLVRFLSNAPSAATRFDKQTISFVQVLGRPFRTLASVLICW